MRYVWDKKKGTWVPADAPAVQRQAVGSVGWPMSSQACGVHPDQVQEANARNKRHGVPVTYCPTTGNAIIPDAGARKKLLKLEGYFCKESFS